MPRFRRKRRTKKTTSVAAAVKRNTKQLRAIAKSTENKSILEEVTATTVVSNATMAGAEVDPGSNYIGAIDAGDDLDERVGESVIIRMVDLRGMLDLDTSTTTVAPTTILLALVVDKQTNTAQMSSEQYWDPDLTTALNAPNGFLNQNFSGRFRTLWTKRITINPQMAGLNASTTTQSDKRRFAHKHKLSLRYKWNAQTSAISAMQTNSIHLLAIADTNFANIQYQVRTFYDDN